MVKNLIGQTINKAVEKIISSGFEVRIISIDNKVYHDTTNCCSGKKSINKKRINIKIINNIVIDAFIG